MKAHLSRRYRLSASHRLFSSALSAEKNQEVYGKCSHPYGHGHNYVVEVKVGGPVDPVTGMIIDLADLDKWVSEDVVERFHRSNLNLDPSFAKLVPTTENLSKAIFDLVAAHFSNGSEACLEQVRIEETASNSVVYAGKEKHDIHGNVEGEPRTGHGRP